MSEQLIQEAEQAERRLERLAGNNNTDNSVDDEAVASAAAAFNPRLERNSKVMRISVQQKKKIDKYLKARLLKRRPGAGALFEAQLIGGVAAFERRFPGIDRDLWMGLASRFMGSKERYVDVAVGAIGRKTILRIFSEHSERPGEEPRLTPQAILLPDRLAGDDYRLKLQAEIERAKSLRDQYQAKLDAEAEL